MSRVRYRIVEDLPASTRTPEFADVEDHQVRLRLVVEGDEVTVVATGVNVKACEALLLSLGATEIGVDLCG